MFVTSCGARAVGVDGSVPALFAFEEVDFGDDGKQQWGFMDSQGRIIIKPMLDYPPLVYWPEGNGLPVFLKGAPGTTPTPVCP